MPIPAPAVFATTAGYRHIKVNLADPRSQEPLVKLGPLGIACQSHYARSDKQNAPYYCSFANARKDIYLRQAVAERLVKANSLLRAYDLELLALDGYRPIELQTELWNHFIDQGRRTLTAPTEQDCIAFAEQYCSSPSNFNLSSSDTWPVHCTGGSIDVTLRSLTTGSELFMGTIFDDASELSQTRHFEEIDMDCGSTIEARKNRRILYWALTDSGLVNYPYEWWHFDYLNQMWSMNVNDAKAIPCYGPATYPD